MTSFLPNHPFCRFSSQTTQDVGTALQTLQNRHDLNINLILFCYWFAVNHQSLLTKAHVKRLLATIYAWHQRMVTPLQVLCNRVKEADRKVWPEYSLYEDALIAKLAAEQIEQLLIADALPKRSRRSRPSLSQMITHASLNIGTYCQSLYITLDDVDFACLGEILSCVFPDLELHKAVSLCRSILSEKQHKTPTQQSLMLGAVTQ